MKVFACLLTVSLILDLHAQSGSEIFLFQLEQSGSKVRLTGGINITNHKGYDNQPFFHPTVPFIYYASFDDSGRSDIKRYNYRTRQTDAITRSREREYSPTVTPDGNFLSCILQRDNDAQDLVKYPLNGGDPVVLINSLRIGYHAWADPDRLLLFVLGDSDRHTLHLYRLSDKFDTVLATRIGRSLHKIPDREVMSYVQLGADPEGEIRQLSLSDLRSSHIGKTLPGQDHMAWLNDGLILSGLNDRIYLMHADRLGKWEEVEISGLPANLKGITRLAVNRDASLIAVVVSE